MRPPTRLLNQEFCETARKNRDHAAHLVYIYLRDTVRRQYPGITVERVEAELIAGQFRVVYRLRKEERAMHFGWTMLESELLMHPRNIVELLHDHLLLSIQEIDPRPEQDNFDIAPF